MPSGNPFSPDKPIEYDDHFFNQEQTIRAILRCLNRGRSCSIIGGVGMGKTSILKWIQRKLRRELSQSSTRSELVFVPVYFKKDVGRAHSLRDVFCQIIDAAVSQVKECLQEYPSTAKYSAIRELDFKRWVNAGLDVDMPPEEDLKAFEKDLWQIVGAIRYTINNARLVLLLDEPYMLDETLRSDFGWCLLKLLGDEDPTRVNLRAHLSLIIAYIRDPMEHFTLTGPNVTPDLIRAYGAIEPIYLHVFERADAWQLMKTPFKYTLAQELTDEIAYTIYNFTGGHPLLLQSVMSDLWTEAETGKPIDIAYIQDYLPVWSKRHREIRRWIADMISENPMLRAVFELLLIRYESKLTDLAKELKALPVSWLYSYQLRDALLILQSLGVVREVEKQEYEISGELFREWFKPLLPAGVNEANYVKNELIEFLTEARSREETTMSKVRKQAAELESQLSDLLSLANREDFADLYSGDISEIKALLREHLTTLRADIQQMSEVEEANFFVGDPRFDNVKRVLIQDVEAIGMYLEFEIKPKFELHKSRTDDLWLQWQRSVESSILRQGRVTIESLKEVPIQSREYVLDRYYREHKDTMHINRSRSGAIKLGNAEQIVAFFQKWEEAAASLDAGQRRFAKLATDLISQLGDLGFLREIDDQVRSWGNLHGFMVAVPPLEVKVPSSFPLIFVRQQEFTAEDMDRIQKLKMALGAADIYFVFLFTFDGADRVREITKRTVYDVDCIVFKKELLYRVLTARDRDKALSQTITQQASLKRVSPYVVYGPVPLDRVFFGREREINAIVSAVKEASIALVGGRKMGKTSILDRAARSLDQRPDLHLLRLDCQKISDYASFFDKLRALPEAQGIPIAGDNHPLTFGAFVTEAQKRVPDCRIVFVMDEVDDLLENDEGETLLGTFRSLSQEGRCSFVLCGAKVLHERLHMPQSALFNFCDPLILSYLDRESAAKIVTDPMHNMGIALEDESSLANRVLDITSGHPNLIQFLCQTTLEYIDREGRRDISLEDVLKVSQSDKFREFFMEVVWGDATPLEKMITLLLVEKRALNEHGIRQGLQEKGISITIKQLKQALQGLQLYSILTKRRDQFVFVAEFFPQVIGENRDQIDLLVEEFLEEMKREERADARAIADIRHQGPLGS